MLTLLIASTSWTGAKAQFWEAKAGTKAHVEGIYYLLDEVTHTATVTNEFYDEVEADQNKYKDAISIPETFVTEKGGDPYTVIGIMGKAFYNCSELTSVSIPKTVTTIGSQAFDGSDLLEGIIVSPQSKSFYADEGILYNKMQTELIFCKRSFAGEFKVSDDITKIHPFAFNNCKNITEVVLPEGLQEIGNGAFSNCTAMNTINLPTSLTVLGNNAFRNASSLISDITIPTFITVIRNDVFRGCSKIKNVTIPEGVTSIEENAFRNCKSITSIELPSSVTSLGTAAFAGTGITSINIPNGINVIPKYAFQGCKLTSITLNEGLKTIELSAFSDNNTTIESVSIPQSVTSIENNAFDGTNVTNFYINNIPSKIAIGETTPFKKTNVTIHIFNKTKSLFANATNWSKYVAYFKDDIDITHVESITLDNEEMTVLTNSLGKLNATINPTDARVKDVVFTSSNDKIVFIVNAATGDFLAGSQEGTATITCTATDGNDAFAKCEVKVVKSFTPAESVTLNKSEKAMEVDESFNLTATIAPANATYKDIIWVSSDEDVAKVTNGTVTAVGPGNATITAISGDGAARAKCKVSVTFGEYPLADATDYTNDEDAFVKKLIYTRNFKNTSWQALYVPFEINVEDFLDRYEFGRLNNIHQYDNNDDGIAEKTVLEFFKIKTGTLKPNTPYCIKAKTKGVQEIVVENVTLHKAEANTLECSSTETRYTFYGTYTEVKGPVMVANKYYAYNGGNLNYTTDIDVSLKGCRWYLDIKDKNGNAVNPGKISTIFIDEEETTGIENTEFVASNDIVAIYDINGRKLNSFQKGINIVKYADGSTKKITK